MESNVVRTTVENIALTNTLTNAHKYPLPQGSRSTFRAEISAQRAVHTRTGNEAPSLRLEMLGSRTSEQDSNRWEKEHMVINTSGALEIQPCIQWVVTAPEQSFHKYTNASVAACINTARLFVRETE